MDFAGWRTDIFDNDPKIDKLLEGQGAAGFLVYFFLCQRAYGSQGYYYSWSYDDAATTARKIGGGVGSETVRQTVDLCLRIGLFDNKLFAEDGILTSRGIQKRYALAISERTKRPVIKKYWLLGEDEEAGMISCAQKKSFPPENPGYQGAKPGLSTPKEKERERKEKNSKGESPPRAQKEELEKRYGSGQVELYIAKAAAYGYPAEDQLKKAAAWMAEDQARGRLKAREAGSLDMEAYTEMISKAPPQYRRKKQD